MMSPMLHSITMLLAVCVCVCIMHGAARLLPDEQASDDDDC
jgi:hypothetical protein